MNLGFLASHRGSNMQAVIAACKSGRLAARPCVVISNNSGSGALARARQEGIPHYHLSGRTHPDLSQLDTAILDALLRHDVELVILAGYMRKLGSKTLERYRGRIINIHPALLPRHGGEGMYGIHPHESVLAAGDRESGPTVHLVTAEYDRGPILRQRRVPVQPDDTPESLQKRVLAQEHEIYPEVIGDIAEGKIKLPIEEN